MPASGGGSAIPCGLPLPAASANVAPADWLPDVRVRAPVYWYTRSVWLSTIQISWLALDGSIVIPVGRPPPLLIVQLPSSDPDIEYLNTLSVVLSFTTQIDEPSVTMSLGLRLYLLRLKLLAAFWLPVNRDAAFVYLKTLSLLASTIQISVPLVAMPSTVALEASVPAVHEPSNPPLVSYTYTLRLASTTQVFSPATVVATPRGAVLPLPRPYDSTSSPVGLYS
jgi:hypothetical protein